MKKLIEKVIRKRNPSFQFDEDLEATMMLDFFHTQLAALLRGMLLYLRFRNPRMMLRGRGVRFFCLHRVRWGRFLKLGDHVFISGLGRKGIEIGTNVGIGSFSRIVVSTSLNDIGESILIGNNVGIGEYAYLGGAGGLSIGDNCIIGQYFSCHPENHLHEDTGSLIRMQGVVRKGISIAGNCWIGSKVTILDGVSIGEGCVIAAGAVVTHSFPPNSVIGGVPARMLRTRGSGELKQPTGPQLFNKII